MKKVRKMTNHDHDKFEEEQIEFFRELEDGLSRANQIISMRGRGFHKLADALIEDWYTEKIAWLSNQGVELKDVFVGDDGREYISDVNESGTYGEEDYQVENVIKRVPDHLDISFWMK